jgi:uncharacterized protein
VAPVEPTARRDTRRSERAPPARPPLGRLPRRLHAWSVARGVAGQVPSGPRARTDTCVSDGSGTLEGGVLVNAERKERRGFASMTSEKQREIASKGGRAAHAKGTAHEWSSDEARVAGRKGGQISRGGRGRLIPP